MTQRVIHLRPFQHRIAILPGQRLLAVRLRGYWPNPTDELDLWLDEDSLLLDGIDITLGNTLTAPTLLDLDLGIDADELALDGDDLQIDLSA